MRSLCFYSTILCYTTIPYYIILYRFTGSLWPYVVFWPLLNVGPRDSRFGLEGSADRIRDRPWPEGRSISVPQQYMCVYTYIHICVHTYIGLNTVSHPKGSMYLFKNEVATGRIRIINKEKSTCIYICVYIYP